MFYFLHILLVLCGFFIYGCFRSGILDRLRVSGMSRTYIKKHTKSFLNYWLFTKLNCLHPMRSLYWLNIVYLTVLLTYAGIALLLGYLPSMKLVVIILSAFLCLLEIPCCVFSAISSCQAEYGEPFVLLRKRKDSPRSGYFSSIPYLLAWIAPLFILLLSIEAAYSIIF